MKKGTQSRGYFIGGIIFVVILTFIVVKGDLLLNYVMSQKDALPVRAVKIDGVFKQLTKKQIADVTGQALAGKHIPSSETKVHLAIYRSFPEAGAVIHTHSIYASALAAMHEDVPAVIEDIVQICGGNEELSRMAVNLQQIKS